MKISLTKLHSYSSILPTLKSQTVEGGGGNKDGQGGITRIFLYFKKL